MDGARKLGQRHRQHTGPLNLAHFRAGWKVALFGIVADQGSVSNEGLEFAEDLLELRGMLDLVLGNASEAVNKAF